MTTLIIMHRPFSRFITGSIYPNVAPAKVILHFEAQETTAAMPTIGIELEFELDLQRAVDVEGVLGLQCILHGLLEGPCKLRNRYGPGRDTGI
jgi:hypothetical protein